MSLYDAATEPLRNFLFCVIIEVFSKQKSVSCFCCG